MIKLLSVLLLLPVAAMAVTFHGVLDLGEGFMVDQKVEYSTSAFWMSNYDFDVVSDEAGEWTARTTIQLSDEVNYPDAGMTISCGVSLGHDRTMTPSDLQREFYHVLAKSRNIVCMPARVFKYSLHYGELIRQ